MSFDIIRTLSKFTIYLSRSRNEMQIQDYASSKYSSLHHGHFPSQESHIASRKFAEGTLHSQLALSFGSTVQKSSTRVTNFMRRRHESRYRSAIPFSAT